MGRAGVLRMDCVLRAGPYEEVLAVAASRPKDWVYDPADKDFDGHHAALIKPLWNMRGRKRRIPIGSFSRRFRNTGGQWWTSTFPVSQQHRHVPLRRMQGGPTPRCVVQEEINPEGWATRIGSEPSPSGAAQN